MRALFSLRPEGERRATITECVILPHMPPTFDDKVLGPLTLRGETWWGTTTIARLRAPITLVVPLPAPWSPTGVPPAPTPGQHETFQWLRANEARVLDAIQAELMDDYNELIKHYDGPLNSSEGLDMRVAEREPRAIWTLLKPI